jgi:hypothetical protein
VENGVQNFATLEKYIEQGLVVDRAVCRCGDPKNQTWHHDNGIAATSTESRANPLHYHLQCF